MNTPNNQQQESVAFPSVKVVFGWQTWLMLIILVNIVISTGRNSSQHNTQEIGRLQNEVSALRAEVSQLQSKIDQLSETSE